MHGPILYCDGTVPPLSELVGSPHGPATIAYPQPVRPDRDIFPGMETFGQKVRQAVESQGLSLDEVAKATGLSIDQIQALQRDDFGALPGDDVVREGLRAFARLVEVHPDEVIADYGRERQRWLEAKAAEVVAVEARDARDEPRGIELPRRSDEPRVTAPSRTGSRRIRWIAILASASIALAVVAFLFRFRSSTPAASSRLAVAEDEAPKKDAVPETRETPRASALESTEGGSGIEQPAGASRLSIREHGVGKDVVDHELVGEADRFAEGKRVWYWTLIQGGTAGESIDHVWLHDGEEVSRVRLEVGGERWRTTSYKDLAPGSEGDWAVEARDEAGRLLARSEFRCTRRR